MTRIFLRISGMRQAKHSRPPSNNKSGVEVDGSRGEGTVSTTSKNRRCLECLGIFPLQAVPSVVTAQCTQVFSWSCTNRTGQVGVKYLPRRQGVSHVLGSLIFLDCARGAPFRRIKSVVHVPVRMKPPAVSPLGPVATLIQRLGGRELAHDSMSEASGLARAGREIHTLWMARSSV